MAVYTIDVLASGIEQGTITSSGDVADSQCVRCIGYLPFLGTEDGKVQMSATATTGKTVQVDLLGYTSNTTTSPRFDLYWYNSPKEFDISSYSDIKYLRIVLKYADGSALIPSEVASCIITYEYVYSWEMEGDYPVPTKSLQATTDGFVKPYPASLWRYEGGDTPINGLMLPIVQERFTEPYPASLWRIDESNGGLPYNDLMLDVLYHEPEPPPPPRPTEIPTVQPTATVEITDQTSVEYRRYMNGYTNPNLYRFRDGELPENTECDVFIKGTHSHRYTSINDYEDFSTECEIP